MNQDVQNIVKLLENFTSMDDEIRSESEMLYNEFEEHSPENAIQTLFQIISGNISFKSSLQALIRLRLFLQSSVSSTPSIPLEVANEIKCFLIEFVNNSDNIKLEKYSMSSIISFYFKTSKIKEMWDGFFQFLIDLYAKEPLISLHSLTEIYDYYKIQELAPHIYDFMNFDQDAQLLAQSLTSGLILIKNKFLFDNYDEFIKNLSNIFLSIPDEYLSEPIETFCITFKDFYDPFLSTLSDIFKYFLDTIADIDRLQSARVQCMFTTTDLALNSNEFRSIILQNPYDVMTAIAVAVSDPYQFEDIYKEAKKSLKYLLDASLSDIEVFDESLKDFGKSDNIYVQSIFLYHIYSDFSLDFAYENIFHDEQIIRHNSMRIIIRIFNKTYEMCALNPKENILLSERDDSKIVDIFVEYLKQSNFEIYKLFKTWCECGGSDSLYKCVDPIIDLLNSNNCDEKVLIMASLLCNCYPEAQELQEVGSELLEFAKNSFSEQADNEVYLEIVKNLLPFLDSERRKLYLNEILPFVFNSVALTVSNIFNEIIEKMRMDFVPYIADYFNVLFKYAATNYTKLLHPADVSDNPNAKASDFLIVFNDSDLRNLQQMMQSLLMMIRKFPEICRFNDFFPKIIDILKVYLVFPYDDEVQNEAILLCADFIDTYHDDDEIDVILELIGSIDSAIDLTYDFTHLSTLSTILYNITKYANTDYIQYLNKLVPFVFKKVYETIQSFYEEDKYFDGMEIEYIDEALHSLSDSYESMFDIDPNCAVSQFQQITSILPYFNFPNLDDNIKEFISIIWVDFLSFAPSNELPESPPDILNDLFEFYHNCSDDHIRCRIIYEIETIAFNYIPQSSLFVLSEFENIIENEDEDLDVKRAVAIEYAKLITKCDDENFILKIDNILRLIDLFEPGTEDIGKFCSSLIFIVKFAIEKNFDNSISQNLIGFLNSLFEKGTFDKDGYYYLLEECKDFEPLQQFSEYIQDLIQKLEQQDGDDSEEDEQA